MCEIRLVRVSDGRVLCQASGLAGLDQLSQLAEQLAEQIKREMPSGPDGQFSLCTIRNRRETEEGGKLASEMTRYLQRELSFDSPLGVAKQVDLRGRLTETQLDLPQVVTDPALQDVFLGARYVVLGGLAESASP
jgi:hypothetical protein